MRVVTPLDLRRSLGRILDEASAGQRFLIERDHHPLAVIVPIEDARRLDAAEEGEVEARRRQALDRLAALGERMQRERPGGPDAVTAVRLDRRRDDPTDG